MANGTLHNEDDDIPWWVQMLVVAFFFVIGVGMSYIWK